MPITDAEREALGRAIQSVRMEEGVTQKELAEGIGISRSHLSEVERGQEPSVSVLFRIAFYLGRSPSEILRRTGL